MLMRADVRHDTYTYRCIYSIFDLSYSCEAPALLYTTIVGRGPTRTHSIYSIKMYNVGRSNGGGVWRVDFSKSKLGDMDTELFKEWFQAFAQAAGITLHIENLYGENNHHIIESCYKALARALRNAITIDPRKAEDVPSTKGTLGGSL